MGGKKKKSAGPAAPPAAPPAAAHAGRTGAAAAGSGVAEEPKKQPGGSKAAKPGKESRSKAPKTYSLAGAAQVDPGGASDKSILKVGIQAELEKKIVRLINEFRQQNGDRGPVSGRLTNKKLLDLYSALEKFGFRREHIEDAMRSSVLHGGDLHSALDWLCLNLPDDELPDGFSQQLQEESQKTRPRFQPAAPAAPAPPAPPAQTPPPRSSTRDDAASVKDWILRYAEQSSDEDEEEEEEEGGGRKNTHNPELDEKFDPNDRYLLLTAQLYDARDMAAAAKAKSDRASQRTAQDRIRILQQEMKQLELHPVFNPAIRVVDVAQRESKVPPPSEDREDLGFQLFERAEKAPPAEKGPSAVRKNEPKDVRNLDYTARSWTGKSPKQFLIDWVRKNLPKSPAPAFHKVAAGRYWRCRVRVQRTDDVLEVCPTILTEDSMQAQHLAATLALYTLVKGQSVHQLLPPPYREVWLEWRDGEQQRQEESRSAANKPRDQFISRLLARLKQQQNQNQNQNQNWGPAEDFGGGTGRRGDEDLEPEESWESLAGLDVSEGGQEDGSERTGGRDGAAALQAARELLVRLRTSPLACQLKAEREQLPVFQHRLRVLEALQRHPVVVVAGETGSGKSTQIPQFLLEELLGGGETPQRCNIMVTQPRRISAMSLASRVSQELGCPDGPGSKTSLCGYQIRMENRSGDWTRLLYCTTGVLLRRLQHDTHLSALTHIVVDEVHERSVQSDFLLTILKDVVRRRSDLRLVLMSATVDCHKFSSYFNRCPVISIPGRTFPVEVFHLEDIVEETGYVLEKDSEYCQKILEEEEEVSVSVTQKGGKTLQHQELIVKDPSSGWDLGPDLDHFSSRTRQVLQYMNPNKINMELLVDLLAYLDKAPQFSAVDGAVLVFLPGLAHIQQLYDLLTSDQRFRDKNRFRILALHSTLSSRDQAAAFTVPPAGVRKIVLSTNIAETGVTIPDVVFVIDTGKTKENKYHESSQMSSLVETFVSKASALQRQGRAGRVRNGFCFRLYPKYRFEAFMDYSVPEILRVPLEELCLHIMNASTAPGGLPEPGAGRPRSRSPSATPSACCGGSAPAGPTAPPSRRWATPGRPARQRQDREDADLRRHPGLHGARGHQLAAAIAEKSPFSTPMNRKEEATWQGRAGRSQLRPPHLYNAYLGWRNAQAEGLRTEMSYCRKHFLNRTALLTMEDVKKEADEDDGGGGVLVPPQAAAAASGRRRRMSRPQVSVLNAVLTAGLYESVARVLCTALGGRAGERVAVHGGDAAGRAQVHPSSVNRNPADTRLAAVPEKVKYGRIYLRDTTLISPFPMLLFGGASTSSTGAAHHSGAGWIHFQAPVRIGVIFKH
ncbi:LOW QUALITY PROTEIN: ATP-dependent RNA helicase DHX29 [Salarias fasciatus]|uniref:LOW QUALITY PROTEIN: ATP-dependent RNA helicase DHX29 n=1 Tax=Salarias fasciatus TaxID=181472 RepID=UPI001176D570|nr:LOW QUALITY PROTEIN: ATP-dependent RNA helicase DHX29-like [Salarias fasciatus]